MNSLPAKLVAACLLSLFFVAGCEAPPPPAKQPTPTKQTPFRFVVIADTHFGYTKMNMPAANRRLIQAVESYPGAKPTDVLICGDLTENGTAAQWAEFLKFYGPGGLCTLPVKLCTGNHDRPNGLLPATPVLKGVAKLHGGLLHRWRHGGVEFLSLDSHPKLRNARWLETQLATIDANTPVVLLFHYNVTGPYSNFWSNKIERALYEKTLRAHRNIIAVFHGHYHETTNVPFADTPHLSPGSPKYRRVFLVCDVTADAMRVRAVTYTPTGAMNYGVKWETTIPLPTRK